MTPLDRGRRRILALLERYRERHGDEIDTIRRVEELVRSHADCLLRSCTPGHLTASAWIVDPEFRRCLLTHHRKLERWLQLGGHADGDPELCRVAVREAEEESGLRGFSVVDPGGDRGLPLDVDVHWIPERGAEPAHWHHDFRFLLVAPPGQPLRCSDESIELRWWPVARLRELCADASVLRLAAKAAAGADQARPG